MTKTKKYHKVDMSDSVVLLSIPQRAGYVCTGSVLQSSLVDSSKFMFVPKQWKLDDKSPSEQHHWTIKYYHLVNHINKKVS